MSGVGTIEVLNGHLTLGSYPGGFGDVITQITHFGL